jgi:hypothetical protein
MLLLELAKRIAPESAPTKGVAIEPDAAPRSGKTQKIRAADESDRVQARGCLWDGRTQGLKFGFYRFDFFGTHRWIDA